MAQEKELRRFQDNLATMRKLFGWTIDDLAKKIGVTKQTISNIENRKTELSRVQYIAMRTVFEAEARARTPEEQEFLIAIISRLVDSEDLDDSEEQQAAVNNAKLIASAIAGGTCLSAAIAAIGLLTPAAPLAATYLAGSTVATGTTAAITGGIAGGTVGWLATLLKKEDKKNGKDKK
jgi:DNA-binding XRE family transcriptional regulator